MAPRFSIVIPTYNRSWGVKRAIECALAQSYSDFELVVVDNCSRDDTRDVVAAFRDPRLVYFRQEQTVPMALNWGRGVELAHGHLFSFLMDDDLIRPDFLAHRAAALDEHPDAVAVFSQYEHRELNGKTLGVHNEQLQTSSVLVGAELVAAALYRQWFVGAAVYRREAALSVWPAAEPDDLVVDFSVNLRLALQPGAKGVYIPCNDFIMTIHPGQHSQARQLQVFEQTAQALKRVLAEPVSEPHRPLIRRELSNWHVLWGRHLAETGARQAARGHYLEAIRTYPRLRGGWTQLLASFLR